MRTVVLAVDDTTLVQGTPSQQTLTNATRCRKGFLEPGESGVPFLGDFPAAPHTIDSSYLLEALRPPVRTEGGHSSRAGARRAFRSIEGYAQAA